MKKLNFSNRIALYFLLATSTLILILFATVYFVVYETVFNHLDEDLNAESSEVLNGLVTLSDQIVISNTLEWGEPEHRQIEVNPAFVQLSDTLGRIIKKTPNLYGGSLIVNLEFKTKRFYNTHLADAKVRQVQMPVKNHLSKVLGYVSIAIPLKDSELVLYNLRMVLIITFPVVLIILYLLVDLLVKRNIYPINEITKTAEKITHENLNKRITLPKHQDELYMLVSTINNLFDRLQKAVVHEKQFISDASHELRTPLASMKGTFEVMLRKDREPNYYIEKISQGLEEVNRLSELSEQLLLLARYDNDSTLLNLSEFSVNDLVDNSIVRNSYILKKNKISVGVKVSSDAIIVSDRFLLEQIVDNLLSNAAKYSPEESKIEIYWENENKKLVINDHGIGMSKDQLGNIFNRFYRADNSRNAKPQGTGLGMSIVKRLSDILGLLIHIESQPGKGTTVVLEFPPEIKS